MKWFYNPVAYLFVITPIESTVGFFDALLCEEVDDDKMTVITEWVEITRQEVEQIAHEIRLGAWLNGFAATVDIQQGVKS